jgi:hypothetical protein
MNRIFDTIIWGPSLEGIKKAVELTREGKLVLLTGKFGFPGGKASESLASLFPVDYFNDGGVLYELFRQTSALKHGILFRNNQWVLIHPEAIKRVCWQIINDYGLEVLFHVIPLKLNQESKPKEMEVFGREGKFCLRANEILDRSDDRYLSSLTGVKKNKSLWINSFFSESLPTGIHGFRIIKQLDTPIGQYVSLAVKNVPPDEVEHTFNRELDRLSKESWKKYGARILMVPVYPEIKDE